MQYRKLIAWSQSAAIVVLATAGYFAVGQAEGDAVNRCICGVILGAPLGCGVALLVANRSFGPQKWNPGSALVGTAAFGFVLVPGLVGTFVLMYLTEFPRSWLPWVQWSNPAMVWACMLPAGILSARLAVGVNNMIAGR
jgi:hypothetical protein